MNRIRQTSCALAVSAILMAAALPADAELTEEQLAKLAQNPVGNLISVPFQYNGNLNFGPEKGTQNILNIQPVIPISVNDDWNIITRTILPVVWLPALSPNDSSVRGVSDLQFTAFLSPANPAAGSGALERSPRRPRTAMRSSATTIGLGAIVCRAASGKGSPWVYGVLVNNIWSLGSHGGSPSYSNGLIQPFLNYNFPSGTYLTTSPIITVNWKASGSNQWTLPIGGGVGKIFHFGKLPVNMQVAAYYNVARPDFVANWQVRQMQFLFPKDLL